MERNKEVYRIVQSFRRVHHAFMQVFWEQGEQKSLTPVQFLVLSVLLERPNTSLTELAERAHMGNSTMSGVVERLVKAGYISRERLPNDRRSLTLRITSEGEQIRNDIEKMWMDRVSGILDIPVQDRDIILDIHQQIISKLTAKGVD
ncbi:MarR family winged helix-turn-helix transcriptional regulator [Paenibacillus massiliensis]|uniref:MarR family winged helix-turn-helix transcriptional regulator n=1 Tax=Paenibacillus massiliensis TaxID=225917 RepID=UPI000409A062|nr:MarR family transcriptional regulator [Paenibacillus massiliensis]